MFFLSGSYPGSGPYRRPGLDMSALERATEEAFLIWSVGKRAVFGHPFSRSISANALEWPFISDAGRESDSYIEVCLKGDW